MEAKKFHIPVKETADSHILYLKGELDLAAAAYFRSLIEPLIDSPKSIVMNLKDLSYIDSTGMGIIIFVLKGRRVNDAPFYIEDIPVNIKRLFDLTGITKFLPVEDAQTIIKADGV